MSSGRMEIRYGVLETGLPFVELIFGSVTLRINVTQARELAREIVKTASEAEGEAFVFSLITDHMQADAEAAATLLAEFMKFYAEHTNKPEVA